MKILRKDAEAQRRGGKGAQSKMIPQSMIKEQDKQDRKRQDTQDNKDNKFFAVSRIIATR